MWMCQLKWAYFIFIWLIKRQISLYMWRIPIIDDVLCQFVLQSVTFQLKLGLRCPSFGYQYSEIVGSLLSVYFCGGDCVEDVTSHLMSHLSLHPTLRTCSSDTILRGISELSTANTTYVSETGRSYDFNTATKLNG